MSAGAAQKIVNAIPKGAKTRHILNLLKEKGRLTRDELFELSSRELIPSKSKLTSLLHYLVENKRAKAFLPVGKIFGKDPFSYKLNPTRAKINFPDMYGNTTQQVRIQKMVEKDQTGLLKKLIEETPKGGKK